MMGLDLGLRVVARVALVTITPAPGVEARYHRVEKLDLLALIAIHERANGLDADALSKAVRDLFFREHVALADGRHLFRQRRSRGQHAIRRKEKNEGDRPGFHAGGRLSRRLAVHFRFRICVSTRNARVMAPKLCFDARL